jgi:anaerobic ribonucleoside-triphosphate reductase
MKALRKCKYCNVRMEIVQATKYYWLRCPKCHVWDRYNIESRFLSYLRNIILRLRLREELN